MKIKNKFFALAAMKLKYQACLVVEKKVQIAILSITLRFDKLCANIQAHPYCLKAIIKSCYSLFVCYSLY